MCQRLRSLGRSCILSMFACNDTITACKRARTRVPGGERCGSQVPGALLLRHTAAAALPSQWSAAEHGDAGEGQGAVTDGMKRSSVAGPAAGAIQVGAVATCRRRS